MSSAIIYPCICLIGYLAAIPLRRFKTKLGWFGTAQTVSVLCLVFAMGVRVGANEEVVRNLDTYGLYSLLFTIVVLVCSIVAIHFARKLIGLDREGLAKSSAPASAETISAAEQEIEAAAEKEPTSAFAAIFDKMTAMILVSVAGGISSGYFFFLKRYGFEQVSAGSSLAISIGLVVLLIFVGLDLGLEGQVFSNIRRVGFKILILPLSVAIGTFVGALLCTLVLPLTDMLSMVNTKMIAEEDTPENREQAYYDMAWLNENMIMRNRTHGGYKVLVDELWEFCEIMNADMVMTI